MESRVLTSLVFFALVFVNGGISGQSEKESMDEALRKELGLQAETEKENQAKPKKQTAKEASPIDERFRPKEEDSGLLWNLVKVLLVFGILIGALYYILRFLSKTKNARYPVHGVMRVLSSLPVSQGKQLQIVDVSGILLVIGVSDNSVNLIKEIESPEIKERIFHSRDTTEPAEESFLVSLLNTVKSADLKFPGFKKSEPGAAGNDEEIIQEIRKRQMEKLESLKSERIKLKKSSDSGLFGEN